MTRHVKRKGGYVVKVDLSEVGLYVARGAWQERRRIRKALRALRAEYDADEREFSVRALDEALAACRAPRKGRRA